MKAFFLFLQNYILTNSLAGTNFRKIETVRMWNDQFNNSNTKRNEKAFRYPACFVEFVFNPDQTYNRSLKIIDYVMEVKFHIGIESMKFTREDTFDLLDQFKSIIQLLAPTIASGLIFTTFQEVPQGTYEETFDDIEVVVLTYRTMFRYTGAYQSLIPYNLLNATFELDTTISSGHILT